jgi:hypothetical protein
VPSSTPLFASDEEALAAAKEAYAAYQTAEDQILAEGGVDGDRIRPFAVRDALKAATDGFARYQQENYRSVGITAFEILGLQARSLDGGDEQDVVTAYLCLDFSNSDVLDANGHSVVRADRPLRQQFEIAFDKDVESGGLVLSSRDPWAGHDSCVA